jgi:hypothetical protein
MKTYRHTAKTDVGTFRSDFTERQLPFAVVYCGHRYLPLATERRVREHEGICYGWAANKADADRLAAQAAADGCLNVAIHAADIRELP